MTSCLSNKNSSIFSFDDEKGKTVIIWGTLIVSLSHELADHTFGKRETWMKLLHGLRVTISYSQKQYKHDTKLTRYELRLNRFVSNSG